MRKASWRCSVLGLSLYVSSNVISNIGLTSNSSITTLEQTVNLSVVVTGYEHSFPLYSPLAACSSARGLMAAIALVTSKYNVFVSAPLRVHAPVFSLFEALVEKFISVFARMYCITKIQ